MARGSLELSINAIVILIIAITLLGLGLAFIKGVFSGTVERLTSIEESLSEQEREELLDSPKEITFLLTEIKVSGREHDLNVGVRNNRPDTLVLAVSGPAVEEVEGGFECFDAIGAQAARLVKERNEEDDPLIDFNTFETLELEGAKSRVLPVQITVAADAPPTTYSCKLEVYILKEEILLEGGQRQVVEKSPPELYARQNFLINYQK